MYMYIEYIFLSLSFQSGHFKLDENDYILEPTSERRTNHDGDSEHRERRAAEDDSYNIYSASDSDEPSFLGDQGTFTLCLNSLNTR